MKIILSNKLTGESTGVHEVNSKTVKALKKWVANQIKQFPETEIIVAKSVDCNLKREFENYIKSFKQKPEFEIVGVSSKKMRDFCYKVNSITPLHICQSLYRNMKNLEIALQVNNTYWYQECIEERIELYRTMALSFGLDMIQTNQLLWEEYGHLL